MNLRFCRAFASILFTLGLLVGTAAAMTSNDHPSVTPSVEQ